MSNKSKAKPTKQEIDEIIKNKRNIAGKKKVLADKKKQLEFMIDGRKVSEIQLQNDTRAVFLNLMKLKIQLEIFESQIDSGKITMTWEGMIYPMGLLQIQHDIILHNYKIELGTYNYKLQQLKKIGFTLKQIDEITNVGKLFGDTHEKKEPQNYIG